MAADINHVILVGRLTRDVELKYTNSGMAVGKLGIAVNRRRKNNDGWVDEVSFFNVTIWGKTAESLQPYLTKGKQIAVDGELRQNRWEQNGQTRSTVEISANNIQLLGGKTSGGGRDYSPSGGTPGGGAPSMGSGEDFEDDIPF